MNACGIKILNIFNIDLKKLLKMILKIFKNLEYAPNGKLHFKNWMKKIKVNFDLIVHNILKNKLIKYEEKKSI